MFHVIVPKTNKKDPYDMSERVYYFETFFKKNK